MFWILHIAALFVFMPALFLTVPLHMIHGAVKANRPKEPDQ